MANQNTGLFVCLLLFLTFLNVQVLTVMICDTLHQAFISHAGTLANLIRALWLLFFYLVYTVLITNYGNPLALKHVIWYAFVAFCTMRVTNHAGPSSYVQSYLAKPHVPHSIFRSRSQLPLL